MCLLGTISYDCSNDNHDDCDGFSFLYPPGACKGFPSTTFCTCACGHEAAKEKHKERRQKLNNKLVAIGRPELVREWGSSMLDLP